DVHADRLRGEPADEPESLPQLMSVHVHHRQGLDDTDAARLGHGGDELRVRAREHGAADQRHGDTRVAGERGVELPRGHRAAAGTGWMEWRGLRTARRSAMRTLA